MSLTEIKHLSMKIRPCFPSGKGSCRNAKSAKTLCFITTRLLTAADQAWQIAEISSYQHINKDNPQRFHSGTMLQQGRKGAEKILRCHAQKQDQQSFFNRKFNITVLFQTSFNIRSRLDRCLSHIRNSWFSTH